MQLRREVNMEDKYNVDKLEFWNRIRLGLEDQLLKNHDIKVDYDIKYHYSYDGIIFGTIGHYERDWFNILELKNNLSGRQDGAEKAIKELDGNDLSGRNVTVNEARPRKDRTKPMRKGW